MEGPMTTPPEAGKAAFPARRPVPSFRPSPEASVRARFNYFKAGSIVPVGIYGVVCALDPTIYRFLDRVDLVFHEAGHVIFGFFGEFIGLLGGSLMQVLIPAIVTGYFICTASSGPGWSHCSGWGRASSTSPCMSRMRGRGRCALG